jgi:hypothetical protein
MNGNKWASPELTALQHERPSQKMSQIRLLWPEIKTARAMGHTLKVIHSRIVESGIPMSYPLFKLYVSRLRREESRPGSRLARAAAARNPFANYIDRSIENRPRFFETPDPKDLEKLI